jgi:uncharacterized protein (TIGR04255 family)
VPLSLPTPNDTKLLRSPLAIVVCQVRYEQNLTVSDGGTALAVAKSLGGRDGPYPRLEAQQQFAAQVDLSNVGSPGISNTIPTRGWKFSSSSGDWSAIIMPDHAALETNAYTTWTKDFLPRVTALIEAVAEHVSPQIEERLGLRYVNRLPRPDEDSMRWSGIVVDELLGPAADNFWAEGIESLQQQLQLDLGPELSCILRHGIVPNANGQPDGYLLDYDVFRQYPQPFDLNSIIQALGEMNRAALSLFQASLTKQYLDSLRTQDA